MKKVIIILATAYKKQAERRAQFIVGDSISEK
jgi:hypothetical protein